MNVILEALLLNKDLNYSKILNIGENKIKKYQIK